MLISLNYVVKCDKLSADGFTVKSLNIELYILGGIDYESWYGI